MIANPEQMTYWKALKPIWHDSHLEPMQVFTIFARVSACAVAAQSREEEYLETIKGLSRANLDALTHAFGELVNEMEGHHYEDVLGPLYLELQSESAKSGRGEFYTPPNLCDMAAEINFSPDMMPPDRPLTVCEPASGAGGMVLSFAKVMAREGINPRRMHVTTWDINRVACDMAYTNLTLWGIPARVVHGNPLSNEVFAEWSNPIPVIETMTLEEKIKAMMRLLGMNERSKENGSTPRGVPDGRVDGERPDGEADHHGERGREGRTGAGGEDRAADDAPLAVAVEDSDEPRTRLGVRPGRRTEERDPDDNGGVPAQAVDVDLGDWKETLF